MASVMIFIGVVGWICLLVSIIVYFKTKEQKNTNSIKNENEEKPKVVVIGGGTGQSVFLRGLKYHTQNITAIVTVADDGGGSGVLREDLGMLPPGDIRNCLLSLANIEPTMNEVMQYRFEEGALKGQSFGNLFLAAMTGLYGNFENAVYRMSQIFAITGKVLPVSLDDINLVAELEDGEIVVGESIIPKEVKKRNSRIKKISLDNKNAKPLDEVISSIKSADAIVIGPGSLYTSILPNLLVEGVVDALSTSKAPVIYLCNIMTQPGETDNMDAVDHVRALIRHAGVNFIDYIIVNNEELPMGVFERYAKDGAQMVVLDNIQRETIKSFNIGLREEKLIEIKNGYIRHDSELVSKTVIDICNEIRN